MIQFHKHYIYDENNNPIAVQIPLDDFKKIETLIEHYKQKPAISEEDDQSPKEKVEWNAFSVSKISDAYSENEPEYSLNLIKEKNTEYKS